MKPRIVAAALTAVFLAGCAPLSKPYLWQENEAAAQAALRQNILTAEEIKALPVDAEYEAERKRQEQRGKLPIPSTWRSGAIWLFKLHDKSGRVRAEFEVNVTDEPHDKTCQGEGWRRLTVVRDPQRSLHDPAYRVDGGNLAISLGTGICDGYHMVGGDLDEAGFSGKHWSSSLLGGTVFGRATGTPVLRGR